MQEHTGTSARLAARVVVSALTGLGLAVGIAVLVGITILGQQQAYAKGNPILNPNQLVDTSTTTATATATTTCGSQPGWVLGPTEVPGAGYISGVTASDGNFYAVGGQDSGSTATPTAHVEKFDSTANAWSTVAPLLVAAGQIGVGAPIAGKVYGAGGYIGVQGTTPLVTNTLQIYDIAANSWSLGPSVPITPGIEAPAAASYGGKFYLFGGDDGGTAIYSTTYILDAVTGTWSTGAPMPEARTNDVATVVNGIIYVYAGVDATFTTRDSLFAYNPTANTWATLAPSGHPEAGFSPGIAPYGTGQFVVDGGMRYEGGGQPTNLTLFYNIALNNWSVGPNLNVPRAVFAEDRLPDGRVIAYAGVTTNFPIISSSELLAPSVPCATATSTSTATATATATSTATPTSVASATYTQAVPSSTSTTAPPTSTQALPTNTAAPTATTCSIEFPDVPPGSTFYVYVHCLACRGVISGYPNGTFGPNNPVTRGQLSKIVSNSAGYNETFSTNTFEDVPVGSTYFAYVERLYAHGAIQGYACGGPGEPCVPPGNKPYFRPGANVTRGQTSKIVAVARQLPPPNPGHQTFQDVAPGSTFWTWIEALAATGAIGGYACGEVGEPCVPPANRPYFRPGANVTRGQSAKIVSNTFFPNCAPSSKPIR